MSGCEWIVEAHGCPAEMLVDAVRLRSFFDTMISAMELHPVGEPVWHQFPQTGGLTGLSLLEESHIACHTFPEFGTLCLNVFCCRPRPEWDFAANLKQALGAETVTVRRLERPYS